MPSHMVCCFNKCTNSSRRTQNLSFHKFPADKNMCKLWVMLCQNDRVVQKFKGYGCSYVSRTYRVCSEHFKRRDFSMWTPKKKVLHRGSVPMVQMIGAQTSHAAIVITLNDMITEEDNHQVANNIILSDMIAEEVDEFANNITLSDMITEEEGNQVANNITLSDMIDEVTNNITLNDMITEENNQVINDITLSDMTMPSIKPNTNINNDILNGLFIYEPDENTIDDNFMVEPNNVPLQIPKRSFPDLEIPDNLKRITGNNCYLAHVKNSLIQLPCQPNVVTLFENYLRHSARNNFSDIYSTGENGLESEIINIQQLEISYDICVEVLDCLRICFNTFLFKEEVFTLLVNEDELAQYYKAIKMNLQPPMNNIPLDENIEQSHVYVTNGERLFILEFEDNKSKNRHDELIKKADSWKAVPDSEYNEEEKQPAIIYGAHHLLRLMDNLPEILTLCTDAVVEEKIIYINSICNGLLKYLSTQAHLFNMQCYSQPRGKKTKRKFK